MTSRAITALYHDISTIEDRIQPLGSLDEASIGTVRAVYDVQKALATLKGELQREIGIAVLQRDMLTFS
jgi:hypothetical protein